MLAAALQRKYSASPHEQFYTGGGIHTFANFDPEHDAGVFTLRNAFYNSINLVFIRLMRDIVQYYKFQIPGISDLLSDVKNPLRLDYLSKFADQEGSLFLRRFYRKYAGVPFDEALALLLHNVGTNPGRLAAIFRYVAPESDLQFALSPLYDTAISGQRHPLYAMVRSLFPG
jgi:membrane peptidoglycan carboxypeptidase